MTPRASALPEIMMVANRETLPAEAIHALEKLRVALRLSQPAQCELTFAETSEALNLAVKLAPGNEIVVTVGRGAQALFTGRVTAAEYIYGPANRRDLRIRAYDKLHSLRKRQSIRTFSQASVFSLAQELCADLGLSVEVADPGPTYEWLIQHRQSDWQLLLQMAERCGLYLTLRDNILHLITLEGIGEPVDLELGKSLLEARIEINGDATCRSVVADGWYPMSAAAFEGLATTARSGRRIAAEVPPDRLGGTSQLTLIDEVAQDDNHANALAQAELDRRAAGEATLWGIADGDPWLRPGTPIEVSGIASTVTGRYILTQVTHTIDTRMGFVSEISTSLPARSQQTVDTIATPGVVSQINDPSSLGRVRVKLTAYHDVETNWIGVLTPGAGSGKGLIALPDIDDHVLVLLAHEDPSQGIVLGGLYGVLEPPDVGLERDARRRFTFVTPGGQRVRLDDAKGAVQIENKAGSYLELSPEIVRIHATTNLEIEAPGKQIAIRAAAIDFEKS